MPLINHQIPSNAGMFFSYLINLCTYDFIDVQVIEAITGEEYYIDQPETESNTLIIYERIMTYGFYDHQNVFANFATLAFFTAIYYFRVTIMVLILLPIKMYIVIKRSF